MVNETSSEEEGGSGNYDGTYMHEKEVSDLDESMRSDQSSD